jgi:hypothetical protein
VFPWQRLHPRRPPKSPPRSRPARAAGSGPKPPARLHDDEGQYRTLLECRPKPYVLDDATVDRVIRVFTQQKDDLPLYEEQVARWAKMDLTASQRQELAHLNSVLAKLHDIGDAILAPG